MEVFFSVDVVLEFWRVGFVVLVNFNVASRARVEYDDDKVCGEFLVWVNEDVWGSGVVMIFV